MPVWALVLWFACWPGAQGPGIDVSRLSFGPPVLVADVDTAKLKGDLKRLAWEPDGTTLYLQTVEGKPPGEKVRHYTVEVVGGAPVPVDREPDWAAQYWAVKQDRVAPGLPSLVIDVQQGIEKLKPGTGASGVLDRESSPVAVASGSPNVENLANGQHGNENATVTRLKLAGEDIAVWVNERPFPGAKFSWGPAGSGALVYTGEHGELVFFDGTKHRKAVPDVKDASLPAWSADGARLAFVQRTGRKKVAILWLEVVR
jgi:dipeptidyl aminopeptidase/acylaminoacyl peptidase